RWCLMQATEYVPGRTDEVRNMFAAFLAHQFGCQTMQQYGRYFGRVVEEDEDKNESGTWELHTLGEDETIAKLASGVKRFKLPDEFNFIRVYQEVSKGKGAHAEEAMNRLCQIFENRRQYPKAAQYWRDNIARFGPGHNGYKTKRLEQVVGNWGVFEPVLTQPAGEGATVEYRFRNATKVSFEAHAVKIEDLLQDVKAHIKAAKNQLDWNSVRIEDIGYRLIYENQTKYVGEKVASWDLELKPRANHFDRRITVATPLQKAGAYLLVATLPGGNTSRMVIWLADTAIVHKALDQKSWYYVADAVTGAPLARVNVEFFGYRSRWVRRNTVDITTRSFAEFTDDEGQIVLDGNRQPTDHQWVAIARTDAGRLAYLGWQGVWYGRHYDAVYNQTKVFVMTDRPVYRPEQKTQFKFWVNTAKYDVEGKSEFAGQTFTVEIRDPRNEKVLEQNYTVDDFGGAAGELELKKDATLGVYRLMVKQGNNHKGGGTFRVEEYKKPEFEVTVEAPKDPVALGDKVTAKVQAKYYFGAPVLEARVKYKVLRTEHTATWYPWAPWDWLFGEGYWWFGYDYHWYPGWGKWGCARPVPFWWGWRPTPQPEVVAENEVDIGKDGTITIEIDTSVAKAIHGDRDHKYSVTAEVTDKSRRTIVGTGDVLVARRPFKVYAWVGRGHYRVGDVVRTSYQARRLDAKGVQGTGFLRLLKITYPEGKPFETEVANWKLNTDEDGRAEMQLKASEPGQYRLSYRVTDAKEHVIEGGYVFVVWGKGDDGSEFRFNDIELTPDKQDYKPGEQVKLRINTRRRDATVLLFLRPANGVYLPPKLLRLKGRSAEETVEVVKRDMPIFFIEAVTISDGKLYQEVRQLAVPPEKRVLEVKITAPKKEFKPGEKTKVRVQLVNSNGEPFEGSTVLTVYDKAVEYISGGSNVPDIKEFFWKWKRNHQPRQSCSLDKGGHNVLKRNEIGMSCLGVFGFSVADELTEGEHGDVTLQMAEEKAGG
ncbi:MAG TPA: MG2 domain-containing protein, partial [Planctomycetota bacterium]|nr:MG2 domain-containing protein [Planctomycetota bacterium]